MDLNLNNRRILFVSLAIFLNSLIINGQNNYNLNITKGYVKKNFFGLYKTIPWEIGNDKGFFHMETLKIKEKKDSVYIDFILWDCPYYPFFSISNTNDSIIEDSCSKYNMNYNLILVDSYKNKYKTINRKTKKGSTNLSSSIVLKKRKKYYLIFDTGNKIKYFVIIKIKT